MRRRREHWLLRLIRRLTWSAPRARGGLRLPGFGDDDGWSVVARPEPRRVHPN